MMSSQGNYIFTLFFLLTYLSTTINLPSAELIPADPTTFPVDQPCPLELPDRLFQDVKSACIDFDRNRCCPVLAAWLYSAYSKTALETYVSTKKNSKAPSSPTMLPELPDMPVDNSGSCVDRFTKALDERGVSFQRINSTCDFVSCKCGIRLSRLNCPEAFRVDSGGELVGGKRVKKMEKYCFNKKHGAGLSACDRCLGALRSLNEIGNRSSQRGRAVHRKRCEAMGITWLLHKNTSAYMRTVTAVLRATMMNTNTNTNTNKGDDDDPISCSSSSVNKPYAFDVNTKSSSPMLRLGLYHQFLPLFGTPILFLVKSMLTE